MQNFLVLSHRSNYGQLKQYFTEYEKLKTFNIEEVKVPEES